MSNAVTALLCLWDGWRPVYTLQHVRALARMLRAYVDLPLKIALLTDRPDAAQDSECDVVLQIPDDPIQNNHQAAKCWRRLRFFDPEYSAQFDTPWLLSVDLDTVILDDITHAIVEMQSTGFGFAIQRSMLQGPGLRPYNGSIFLVECGRHRRVWDDFEPLADEARAIDSGWIGSDQVHMSLSIPNAPTFGPEHGFVFRDQYPRAAVAPRLVHYAGRGKPWSLTSAAETPQLYKQWQRFA